MGTKVANVTRDSDTAFKVERSKVNLQGVGHTVAASRTACLTGISVVNKVYFSRVRKLLSSMMLIQVLVTQSLISHYLVD